MNNKLTIYEKIDKEVIGMIQEDMLQKPMVMDEILDWKIQITEAAQETVFGEISPLDLIIIFKGLAYEGTEALSDIHDAMAEEDHDLVGEELVRAIKEHFIGEYVTRHFDELYKKAKS